MILVDSSVVIDFSRTGDTRFLSIFASHDAAICGVTRAELLHGARDHAEVATITVALNNFRQERIPDELWDKVGISLAALRSRGLTIGLADATIATLAIELDVELWTRDKDFTLMQSLLGSLRLFPDPIP